MKLTFLDKLGIGLLALGLSAILGPIFLNSTISFFKDRFQNNFQHITCYGENNKPIANVGIDWRGVRTVRDGVRAWFKLLVPIDELKKEAEWGLSVRSAVNIYYFDENWGEAIEALNTMSAFYFSEKPMFNKRYLTSRPRYMNEYQNSFFYTDAESSVFDEIKLKISEFGVSLETPLNDQGQIRPHAGYIIFGDCRISEPRFFKNPNLIVPYDAPKLPIRAV